MNRIKQILAPPVFEDEEKTRNARVLHTILSTVFLVMTLAAAAVPLAFARKLETAAIVGLIFLILLGVERLLYTGHIRAASTIVVAILVVMAIGLSLVADGAKSIHIIFSFTAVVLAGLLLDKQSMNLAFAASLLGHLALTWLETSNRLPPSLFPTPPVAVWVQVAFNLILITVALGLTRDGIETALDRLRKNELALNQSNAALQSTLVSVEDQVSIRTRELAQAKEAAEAANRQLAAQMWQVAGQAQLSETIRGEQEQIGRAHV